MSDENDRLVREAQGSTDTKTRMDAFGKIQHVLFDDVALLPMFERGVTYAVHPQLKGLKRRVMALILTIPMHTSTPAQGSVTMWRYMLKRLALSVVTIWFIATATFFGMHAVPGDPLTSDKAIAQDSRQLRSQIRAR